MTTDTHDPKIHTTLGDITTAQHWDAAKDRIDAALTECQTVDDLCAIFPRWWVREVLPADCGAKLPRNWTTNTTAKNKYYRVMHKRCVDKLRWRWEKAKQARIVHRAMAAADRQIATEWREVGLTLAPTTVEGYIEHNLHMKAAEMNWWKE